MNDVLVSVCCSAYNHEAYIETAIKSFLMQQTNFAFEIIIHDDGSKDRTQEIIKNYANLHPHIKPILQKENQYSKTKRSIFAEFIFPKAKGKYIAVCEGDDYWTDLKKLQKQVDFLEKNPDYSMVCGGYIAKNIITGEEKIVVQNKPNSDKVGFTITLDDLKKEWLTKTLTIVYRKDKLNLEEVLSYKNSRDVVTVYLLLKNGKGYYFKQVFGVYNIHSGGINSMKQGIVNYNARYNCNYELYQRNRDECTRYRAFNATRQLFNFNLYNQYPENTLKRRFTLLKQMITLAKTSKEYLEIIVAFFPYNSIKKLIREKK